MELNHLKHKERLTLPDTYTVLQLEYKHTTTLETAILQQRTVKIGRKEKECNL